MSRGETPRPHAGGEPPAAARVLERNLEQLLARAWAPPRPSAAFRARLAAAAQAALPRATFETARPRAFAWRRAALVAAALIGVLASLWLARLAWFAERASPSSPRESGALALAPEQSAPPRAAAADPAAGLDVQREREALAPPQQPHAALAAAEPARLRGRALAAEGGAPLAHFEVLWRELVELPRVGALRRLECSAGAFELPPLGAGRYALFLRAPGCATLALPSIDIAAGTPVRELEARLEPGATLAGRVLGPDGRPLAGAFVLSERDCEAERLPSRPAQLEPGELRGALSDAAGRFELADVAAGPQRLRVLAPEAASAALELAAVAPHARIEGLEIRLEAGARLSGRVEREDGTPWARVLVLVSGLGLDGGLPLYDWTQTDAQGQYAFEHLGSGPHVVMHFGDRALEAEGPPLGFLPAALDAQRPALVDFRGAGKPRAQGVALRGRLLDARGQPQAELSLSLAPAGASDSNWEMGLSQPDGSFAFHDLARGAYELYTVIGAGQTLVELARIELGASDLERDFRLPEGALGGRIEDAQAQPLAHAIALLERAAPDGESFAFCGKTESAADGSYRFPFLAPGRYRVRAFDARAQLATQRSEAFELRGSEPLALPALALPAGGALAITVVDAAGRPQAGAELEFFDPAGERVEIAQRQRSAADGSYRAAGLAAGLWQVRARLGEAASPFEAARVIPDSTGALELELAAPR